jgi:O-acetyl-ADP-ribose deacetylase (regulator of RNase III)
MITYVQGSLFESPAKVLVNTVNTAGVMGKGIAKTFKDIYPAMFSQYQRLCEQKLIDIGKLWLYKTDHKWILNFPTKQHWRSPSKPEYIEGGLKKFLAIYSDLGITSVAFPQLGCGNGELDWDEIVKPMMIKYLDRLPIDIFVYLYGKEFPIPEHKDIEGMRAWLRTEPRSLAFMEVWGDLCKIIGHRLDATTWDGSTKFTVCVTSQPESGIRIRLQSKKLWRNLVNDLICKIVPSRWQPRIDAESVFIPQEAILDLWQNIRGYGFCMPRVMPAGLDVLAPYVMTLLSHLDYLKPVELATRTMAESSNGEKALRLFIPASSSWPSPSELSYSVDPV